MATVAQQTAWQIMANTVSKKKRVRDFLLIPHKLIVYDCSIDANYRQLVSEAGHQR